MSQIDQNSAPYALASGNPRSFYQRRGKRYCDLLVAVALLIVFSPVLAVIAALVAWRLGRPVLFRQRRPGREGVPFDMIKFRSMTDCRDERGELLPDEKRLTAFGRFLRAASLDELPELWNIVRGDMSLVGPRPLLMQYVPRYSAEQFRRHTVLPGVTGWAQVNGRNAISWDEKFALDLWYVDNYSLWVDVKTVWLTVRNVISRRDISAAGHATMPEFQGNEKTTPAMPPGGTIAQDGMTGRTK